MAPEVAFNFPSLEGTVPFQQDRAGRAQQSEEGRRQNMEQADSAGLDLPFAQKDDICGQIAPENEQAIRDTERPQLSRQEVTACSRAGSQDSRTQAAPHITAVAQNNDGRLF